MVIGVLKIILHFPSLDSLKGKRQKLNSIKQTLKQRFNISISEVDYKDLWQKSLIAVSMVADDRLFIEQNFHKIMDLVHRFRDSYVVDHHSEFIFTKENENYEEIQGREDQ